jgi:ubiquinone biosynthesis protein
VVTATLALLAFLLPVQAIELPTPPEHYQNYDFEAESRALLLEIVGSLPEDVRNRALAFGDQPAPEEVRALLNEIDWTAYRGRLESVLLHGSRVLEMVPEAGARFIPLIHDSLLLFLHNMSEERLLDRLVAQAALPRDADRGERVLAFATGAPSLQKLSQILARNPNIAPDFRASLQTLENDLSTARYDEILGVIRSELSPETAREFHLEFSDRLLAEASVGAVVVATYQAPGTDSSQRAACKVLKPKAVKALGEDLDLIDAVLVHLEKHKDFYDIGDTPLVDIFHEVREALAREVRVSDEREHLVQAREYYSDVPGILVPAVLPFSTENVTCMEFVEGVKITDAFPSSPKDRQELAKRLSDALTFGVIFSPKDPALFHGDPHAGNVFHAPSSSDPYRIGLLDWGLCGQFTREERKKLAQLLVGLYLKDEERLFQNSDVLVAQDTSQTEADLERRRKGIAAVVEGGQTGSMFALLDQLLTELARAGCRIRYEAALFIKSQITIYGILKELDPGFEQDRYVMSRIQGQVFREIGPRLLRTVWFPDWDSDDYRSLLSNDDVADVQAKRTGRLFKTIGKAIWYGITFQWLF